jgi:BirA family biotin operon repressor/biotin-[acetyl-CoA-carboxylase] ligase
MIDVSAPIFRFERLESTQAEARRRIEAGDVSPAWIMADVQDAGRGRRGRSWASLPGNLMTTYLGRTAHGPAHIALLGFAAALAIADCIDAYAGPGRARLKWPNDVLVENAKIAGILIDCAPLGDGATWFALGMGVNLATAPEGLDQESVSLRALMPPDALAPEPRAFLDRLAARLQFWDSRLEREGFGPLRESWLARAAGLGHPIRVLLGAETLEGRLSGLSETGELILDAADGRRLIAAGDIVFAGAQNT